jgi:hypothetical protein
MNSRRSIKLIRLTIISIPLKKIKARVWASQFFEEELYHFGFFSGLKDEIAAAVSLYNPTSLKQTYKLARQIEKSLESQSRMLKPICSLSSSPTLFKPFKSREEPVSSSLPVPQKISDSTKLLSLDQKRAL